MAAQDCGICLQNISANFLRETTCCRQCLCQDCWAADRVYKAVPTCPFCRRRDYETRSLQEGEEVASTTTTPAIQLDGVWDVKIIESSKIGRSQQKITLKIDGDSAKYEILKDDDGASHYDNAEWEELTFGHTPSGKTFVAKQKLARAPSWMGSRASVMGRTGLRGRLNGPDSAKFTTSVTIMGPRDDELEIVQEAEMTRRRCVTSS